MKKILFLFIFCATNLFAEDSSSNITLVNAGAFTQVIKGFYIQKLATSNSCNALVGEATTPANGVSLGAMWKELRLTPGETHEIGASFLYQMMHQMLYPVYILNPIGGSQCTPGSGKCMAGDAPNTAQWCINLGISTGAPVGPTQSIGAGDLLPLVDSVQIKITCDDSTFTCTADLPTTQNIL